MGNSINNSNLKNNKKNGKNLKNIIIVVLLIAIFIALVFAGVTRVLQIVDKLQKLEHPTKYSEYVEKYSEEFEVDPYLIYAVIKTESGFDKDAVSSVGAIGLMQMTNETFEWVKLMHFPSDEIKFEDLHDPETSIKYGVCLISESLKRFGDISTAAAAYHSGWNAVERLITEQGNQETRILTEFPYNQMKHYVYKINKSYETYLQIYS